jgi:hypothetical protein
MMQHAVYLRTFFALIAFASSSVFAANWEGGWTTWGYGDQKDLPDRPFSDALPIKNMSMGCGFAASIGGSLQHRYQALDNRRDFTFNKNDEDFSLLARERLNLDIRHGHDFRAFFELQDAHEFWRDPLPVRYVNENSLDVYQAFGEIGLLTDVVDKPSLVFRLGRQEITLGKEKLFSDNDWLNLGQTFDAARVIWRPDGFQIDALAAMPVIPDNRNPDSPSSHENVAGINLKALGIPLGHTVEGYAFYKWNEKSRIIGERGESGPEQLGVLGGRADGRFFKHFDYDTEVTLESGERGEDNVFAWRATAELGYVKNFNWRALRFAFAYTQASGDKNPTDGSSQTFDTLWGDQFSFHGKLLVAGPKNLIDYNPKLQAKLWRNGLIELDYRIFRLQQSKDAFYQASSSALRRDKTGRAGRDAGREFDVQITHNFHENLSLSGGAFLFEPGNLFKRTGNKGNDLARSFFVMVRTSF